MDMGKSSEAEPSGGVSLAIDYDVFLSFRWPDTRQTFTDCLYHGMLEANIRVLFNEEELHVGKEIGDELPTAIEKSKIYVPVFSQGYASSPWCLRELAHMVECAKSRPSEKEIMPIFYNVEPCDVKLKSQRYVDALEENEEKFGRRTRLKWEDALRSVARIKGWELKKKGHWHSIKSVIQTIVMKLKTKDIYVPEHLIGMDDQVEAVLKLLDKDSGGMRFVLIHGMGGIGKATLAKIVFNKLNPFFSHSCFLGNVRESSLGLVNLQKQLLFNMFGSGFSVEIIDVDDGIKVLFKSGNSRAKILVRMDPGKSSEAGTSGGESSAFDYEVFLSFRGPDTRQGFTDCLYHYMLDANIDVFLDEEELHVGKEIGDELPTAIEKSKIYIPIFSKGYASSAWCLRELAHMVECKKSKPSEKEIMPIFYDVEPCDVKLKTQLYIGALEEHEKKFGPQTRLKWEDALKSVGEIKGWELKKQGHGEFIKSVIREILMNLKIKDKHVTEHLVGMDDRVETVVKLLDVDSGGMRCVLIHGMGGIGKTTLAKVVFNKLNSLFSHSCFLGNVRESSLNFGLVTLQKQLLTDMFGSGFHGGINDVNDGIRVIVQQLSNKKVFIVLDDVDDEEQLEKLAFKHISFGSGSRVILTTRNRSLVEADQTLEYGVTHLDPVQSLELFSRHAFGRNPPPDDYVSLSRQVVSTTGGLPLALEVIGSLLCQQDKASWMDVLDRPKEIPHKKVQDQLKISYNALSHQQKQIFLDIACLFVDRDKTNAFYMWKDCRFIPDYSIQVLVRMSLINITHDNKFWMHNQLRDLGRNIARGDTRLMDPRKQSRFWFGEGADDIIRTVERKEAIEAVYLDGSASGPYTSEEFSRLPNIRFLHLFEGQLEGDFKNQLSELRYMDWLWCPRELLAINFHPSNLVVLDLSNGDITEDWAGWSQIKVAKKLKVLDLSHCRGMTRTPNFSDYLSLERLILRYCSSLIEVDGSLEKLKCLTYFNAHGCYNLAGLPEGIGGLKKLEYLYLGHCRMLRKLPESFGRLASLVELDLSYTAITRLPDSIGNHKCLSVLKLQSTKITELPSSIGNLRKLKSLILSNIDVRELPVSIGNLESLLELDLLETKSLLRLPKSIGGLSRLKVIKMSYSSIRELPWSIVELKELEELHAEYCSLLKWEIPEGIWKLSLLRVLQLEYTPIGNVPETIKLLPRLETLGLYCCSSLELLPELPTSLVSLSFGSSSLRSIPDLSNLTQLVDLRYSGHDENYCPLIFQDGPCRQSLGFLPPCLSTLSLDNHRSITSLSLGCNLRNLTCLRFEDCRWKEVQFDGLEQLIELNVEGLELLEGFAGLSRLKRLKLLRLFGCPNLTAIQGLGSVESLEQLEINSCGLEQLIGLEVEGLQLLEGCASRSSLKRLKQLRLLSCPNLTTIQGLGSMESLKQLKICRCPKIESLDDLSDLKKLESLEIEECEELLAIKGLDELETLKKLNISCCRSLRSFTNESLLELDVSETQCLLLPESIGDLNRLKVINFSDSLIRELPQSIVALKELEEQTSVATVEHVIGIDDQVKDVIKLLAIENDEVEVRIVGIYGTSGIGKTTIAKAVYDRLSSCFDSCSFLSEIGETTQNVGQGIQCVQTKLIRDILERDCDVASFEGGIKFFHDVFGNIKALIILDDVEKQSHLDDLVGNRLDWFGPGSRIIVTTENHEILQTYVSRGLACIYDVNKMGTNQAFELFCKHALGTHGSISDYPEIGNRIIKAEGQIPLVIEVIGSFLRGKTIEDWSEMEKSIKPRTKDSREILKDCGDILKICYEVLDEKQKQIFWDIAWFANGVDSRIASYMWPDRHILPSHQVLMPLAKIGEDNMLWMHKRLKRLCRTIDQEERKYPVKRRRLYMHDPDLKAFNKEEGMVEALCCDFKNLHPHTFTEPFPNVRFLKLDHASMTGNFANVFPKLRWLRWQGCPRDFKATELNLTELVILDLSWSKVTEDWGVWRKIKMEQLKVLNLTGCTDLLMSPKFSSFPNLEILILERCSRLVHLDHSVGGLKKLLCLNLKSCTELNRLPAELGALKALKELLIDETSVRYIPLGGDSKELETLSASNCLSLSLPDGVGELVKLRRLSFLNCRLIRKLPKSIGQLGSPLEELDISGTSISELSDSLRNLQRLRVLKMDYCIFISKFPSFIWHLHYLEEIHASSCRNLEGEIPGDIRQLINLRILRLRNSAISSLPPEIKLLSKLETLDVLHCNMLQELPELPSGLVIVHLSPKLKEKASNHSVKPCYITV